MRLLEFLRGRNNSGAEEARLRHLQELILESAGEGIYGLDAEGRVTFMNASAVEMLGWTLDALVGRPMHEVSHHSRPDGAHYPASECLIRAAMLDGKTHRTEDDVFWRADGTSFPVEYVATPIREGDKIRGSVVAFSDISERKLGEKAVAHAFEREREWRLEVERANAELEAFAYTVSHDLNSPLVSIGGFLEFVMQDYGEILPEQGRFYLERIAASTRNMQALIRGLLEFSRVGRSQTEIEPVDLGGVISEVAEEVRSTNPAMKVKIESLPVAHMNPIRARQLFSNLLQNAARYAGREPQVTVSMLPGDDGEVSISVADDGPGIPGRDRERAFGIFERLEDAQSEDGTGIGLAICKRIVESIGGHMWIADSQQGTDVRILLPTDRVESIDEEERV